MVLDAWSHWIRVKFQIACLWAILYNISWCRSVALPILASPAPHLTMSPAGVVHFSSEFAEKVPQFLAVGGEHSQQVSWNCSKQLSNTHRCFLYEASDTSHFPKGIELQNTTLGNICAWDFCDEVNSVTNFLRGLSIDQVKSSFFELFYNLL